MWGVGEKGSSEEGLREEEEVKKKHEREWKYLDGLLAPSKPSHLFYNKKEVDVRVRMSFIFSLRKFSHVAHKDPRKKNWIAALLPKLFKLSETHLISLPSSLFPSLLPTKVHLARIFNFTDHGYQVSLLCYFTIFWHHVTLTFQNYCAS